MAASDLIQIVVNQVRGSVGTGDMRGEKERELGFPVKMLSFLFGTSELRLDPRLKAAAV